MKFIFFNLFFFYIVTQITAQEVVKREIDWSSNDKALLFNDLQWRYYEKLKVDNNVVGVQCELVALKYQVIASAFADYASELNPRVEAKITQESKEKYVIVSIDNLIQKNGKDVLGLSNFEIKLQYIYAPSTKGSKSFFINGGYANNSVLAKGNWYKIAVNRNGVYRLTYSDLKNMGIDVDNINPKKIRLFGTGGAMLPEKNDNPRYDDLPENAIYVEGEEDNKFDSNDFILFYGESPDKWRYNPNTQYFEHQKHLYSDLTYYFLTVDDTEGKRIQKQNSIAATPTYIVNTFNDYDVHALEQKNLINSGKNWVGEEFNIINEYATKNFSFPNITGNIFVRTKLLSRCIGCTGNYEIRIGNIKNPVSISSVVDDHNSNYANEKISTLQLPNFAANFNVIVKKLSPASATGWLDFVEVNARRALTMSGNQMLFRDVESFGDNNIATFNINTSGNNNLQIWEVTNAINPKLQNVSQSGNTISFTQTTDTLKTFIIFDKTNGFLSPISKEKILNQNLHAETPKDLIIVTHPLFKNQAKRLAELHQQEGLTVLVVNVFDIYNEFSSGSQDPTAIKHFIKMLYDKADDASVAPKYVVLFGDGSVDPKNRMPNNTNFIPSYQSDNSLHWIESHTTDDYFAMLDDSEGLWENDVIDVAIGRLPVKNETEAKIVVDKIIDYSTNPKAFGEWRNKVLFIADVPDGAGDFPNRSEDLIKIIDQVYNVEKVYVSTIPILSNSAGGRSPVSNTAINNAVNNGTLFFNFIGHGAPDALGKKYTTTMSDIQQWKNEHKLPIFVTATCDFTPFDNPNYVSAGETILLKENAGGIALLSTVRSIYISYAQAINTAFYQKALTSKDYRLGDAFKQGKTVANSNTNFRYFLLFGDPAMRIAYPKNNVKTTFINNKPVDNMANDTIKALSKVNIKGQIEDANNNLLSNFNGTLFTTVYDKPSKIVELADDYFKQIDTFNVFQNIIYKGKTTVKNGLFDLTFVVPKDVVLQYGFGKISYYAQDNLTDANGVYSKLVVGSFSDEVQDDYKGPDITIGMNKIPFVSGSITDENPMLIVHLSDDNGINTTGSGIGHDIVAILNENTTEPIVLNNFYEANIDDYKSGKIVYPLKNLPEGTYSIRVKAWDIFNNSSEAVVNFVVKNSNTFVIEKLVNYPNPFSQNTYFKFDHNRPNEKLSIRIDIFNLQGSLLATILTNDVSDGFSVNPIAWTGQLSSGAKIKSGLYFYKLTAETTKGEIATSTQRLLVVD